jgi:hypothetical protein
VLRAPRAGIVLPTSIVPAADHLHAAHDRTLEPHLPQRVGALARQGTAWCRVADPAVQVAAMELTGDQWQQLVVGAPIRIRCRQNPDRIVHGRIASISSVQPKAEAADRDGAGRQATATDGLAGQSRFRMVCSLHREDGPQVEGDSAERRAMARWQIGASVTGMVFGERLSLAERAWRAASEFLRSRS